MKREFLINILFLLAINLLIKPFYIFGIDRTVQNTVPPGDYGLYFALFNFTYLLQIINDFGIQNFNNRNIAQHHQLLDKYFPNILILKTLLGIGYLLVVFIAAIISGYEYKYYPLIGIIAINQMLLSLTLYLRSNISGLSRYRVDSVISVTDKLLLIIICSILLWVKPFQHQFQIEWFVYAQTASLGLTALLAFFIVKSHIRKLRFRFRLGFLWLILRKSYPYALVIFLMTAYTRIDAVMIERMLPDGKIEADIYASAYRLLDASNMIGFLFAGLLLPMFAKMIKEKQALGSLVRFSLQFIWAGAIALAVATYWFQEQIMVLLYDDGSAYSGSILGWLMISFIAISGSYIYGTLLTANGSLMKMNRLFAVGVLLNIGLNLWLIPTHQAWGAALATCFTQFFVFFGQVLLAKKELILKNAPAVVIRIVSYILLCNLLAFGLTQLSWDSWFVKFLICIGLSGFLAFLLKLLDLKNLLKLLRS